MAIVQKKDWSLRFSVHYWKLNSVTKSDVFPMLHIDGMLLDQPGKSSTYVSTIDLTSGYCQIKMDSGNQEGLHLLLPKMY